jgi:hypothetical protein
MNPEEALRLAREAIAAGESPEYVDQQIAQLTDYPNIFALRMAVESAADFVESQELAEIGDHPIRAALGAAGQGLSFNFLDDIVGAASPRTGRRMERAQDLREEHAPAATAAAGLAGAMALPAGVGTGAARMTPGAVRGAVTGAARGGLFGGIGGAAAGAGAADPGERLEGAAAAAPYGAGAGAALGAPMGLIGGILGSRAGRANRVGRGMREGTGLEGSRPALKSKIEAEKLRVQEEFYRPIQEQFSAIDDPRVHQFLQDVGTDPVLRTKVPRPFRPGQTGIRSGPGRRTGVLVRGSAEQPSFQDLQDIRASLRKSGREGSARADELTEIMEDMVGEPLREADRAWARVSAQDRAFDSGWSLAQNHSADLIAENRGRLRLAGEREAFNEGVLSRIIVELRQGNNAEVATLKRFITGDEPRAKLAAMFPGGESGTAFQSLLRMMRREASNADIAAFFNSSVKGAGIGLAAGGAVGFLTTGGGN